MLLVVSFALVGVGLIAGFFEPRNARTARIVCGLGAGVSLSSLWLDVEDAWRGQVPRPAHLVVIAVALALAWIVIAARGAEHAGVSAAVLGVASAGLLLFTTSTWVAPALLFWVCCSAAVFVAALKERSIHLLVQLAVPDVLLSIALVLQVRSSDSWALPEVLSGGSFWLLVAAASWRVGVVPWRSWTNETAPLVPLLIGSGAVLMLKLGLRPEPWLSTGAAAAALGAGLLSLIRPIRPTLMCSFVSGTLVSSFFLAPAYAPRGAIALVLTAAGLTLWSLTPAQASIARALTLGALPTAALWVAVAGALDQTVGHLLTGGVPDAIPLATAIGALALVSLLGVAVAARAAHAGTPGPRRGGEAIASWVVATACFAGGALLLRPGSWGSATLPLGRGGAWLLVAAATAGVIAAFVAAGREDLPPLQREPAMMVDQREPRGTAGRLLLWASVGVLVGVFGAAAVLTFQGLRVGFL